MGQKSVDVIRVKQQKNFPYIGKPELELTRAATSEGRSRGGGGRVVVVVGTTGLEVDLTTFLIKRCK